MHWFQIASAMDPLGDHADEMRARTRVLLRRAPDARWHRPADQGAVIGRAAAPLRHRGAAGAHPRAAVPPHHRAAGGLLRAQRGPARWRPPSHDTPGVDGCHLLALVDERKLRRILERMLDEDWFLRPHGIRSVSTWTARPSRTRIDVEGKADRRRVRTGRVAQRHVRRELQLAWPGVVPDQPADHPGPAAVPSVLRRRLPGRVPYRLRPRDDVVRGGRGAGSQAGRDLHPRRSRDNVRSSVAPSSSSRTRPGGTTCCSYEYFHGDNGAGIGASHPTRLDRRGGSPSSQLFASNHAAVRPAHEFQGTLRDERLAVFSLTPRG